jgi:hypothetical protein
MSYHYALKLRGTTLNPSLGGARGGFMLARVRYWEVFPKRSPLAIFLFWENYFWAMPNIAKRLFMGETYRPYQLWYRNGENKNAMRLY